MTWVLDQVGMWLGLSGHVAGWSGVEMALWGGDGDGEPVFHDPAVPFLQLLYVDVTAGGGHLRIGVYQDDTVFGISIRPAPEEESPPWKPGGGYRLRALPELPTGPLRSVEVRQEGGAEGVIAEVSLAIGDQELLLVAGEVEPDWSSWRLRRLDESVLAFADPLCAERLDWVPRRPRAWHVSSDGRRP